ncbi:glycosyltransferase [Planctomicrobium piriforme]|uniref:Glycosyl transferase family 2 n=1 Tax=Planctomicrobium piriforme TaxID=1576369 RepID=A0A1I3BEW9_9PLAN|nr:glycosyltransferase [Planctomicrobium piriforme]SFH60499.1 Glycosyl transferase family 2 [Planctomicrobium piriforme]
MRPATIIVPCYNEARRLDLGCFRRFVRRHSSIRFLLVNDGSDDQTGPLLEEISRELPGQFEYLALPENRGKAEAVRQGMLAAFRTHPKYVGYWDADLATPLEAIPVFCEVLNRRQEIDVVLGARLSLLGRRISRCPSRRILGKLFSFAASQVVGLSVRDTQCGAKLFRTSPAFEKVFSRQFVSRWIFDVEILARLQQSARQTGHSMSRHIYESPLESWREIPNSKLKARDFLRAIGELCAIAMSPVRGPADEIENTADQTPAGRAAA